MIRNNHGWGLKEMLFLSAILLFFVFLIAVLINQLYETTDSLINNPTSYQQVENNLKIAAKEYYEEYHEDYILSDDLIFEKYLTLKNMTVKDDICEGYVTYQERHFNAYITCDKYETEGY